MPLFGRNLLRTPLYLWGMAIAHLGVAVSLAGMASDAAFTRENLAAMKPGDVFRGAWPEAHALGYEPGSMAEHAFTTAARGVLTASLRASDGSRSTRVIFRP